jgi:hypothetical protein
VCVVEAGAAHHTSFMQQEAARPFALPPLKKAAAKTVWASWTPEREEDEEKSLAWWSDNTKKMNAVSSINVFNSKSSCDQLMLEESSIRRELLTDIEFLCSVITTLQPLQIMKSCSSSNSSYASTTIKTSPPTSYHLNTATNYPLLYGVPRKHSLPSIVPVCRC